MNKPIIEYYFSEYNFEGVTYYDGFCKDVNNSGNRGDYHVIENNQCSCKDFTNLERLMDWLLDAAKVYERQYIQQLQEDLISELSEGLKKSMQDGYIAMMSGSPESVLSKYKASELKGCTWSPFGASGKLILDKTDKTIEVGVIDLTQCPPDLY